MTEYFVRNITSVCLPETICKIFVLSLFYPVQRTLCHCEALSTAMPWQSPGREPYYKPTQDTFVLAWRKGINKQKTNNCRLRRLFGQKCSLFLVLRIRFSPCRRLLFCIALPNRTTFCRIRHNNLQKTTPALSQLFGQKKTPPLLRRHRNNNPCVRKTKLPYILANIPKGLLLQIVSPRC